MAAAEHQPEFRRPCPCAKALVRSRNLISIRLLRATGNEAPLRHLGAFGFGRHAARELAAGARHAGGDAWGNGYACSGSSFLVTPCDGRVDDAQGNLNTQAGPRSPAPTRIRPPAR